jgi:adenine-specific DNA-methyltransferase
VRSDRKWIPARRVPDVQTWKYSGNTLHPTQKAVEILTPLIASFSQPGATVLDPFMGSGSTGIAAAKAGRSFVGIELDQGHFETAAGRLGIVTDHSQAA